MRYVFHIEATVLTATWVVGSQYVHVGSTTDFDGATNDWYRSEDLDVLNVVDAAGNRQLDASSTTAEFRRYVTDRLAVLDDEAGPDGAVVTPVADRHRPKEITAIATYFFGGTPYDAGTSIPRGVTGDCPHRHKTAAAAQACNEQHARDIKRGHGVNAYSDRVVMISEDGRRRIWDPGQ